MEKHHLFYKVTNKINGHFYYGVHSTTRPIVDGYLGSGTRIKKAILKYGKQNFTFEILQDCSTREEALELEKKWVTESQCLDSRCYNLKKGGLGGLDGAVGMTRNGVNTLIREGLVEQYEKDGWVRGYTISPEGLQSMAKPRSEETRAKMRVARKISMEKQRATRTGCFSEESLRRRSLAHMGLKQSKETCEKRSKIFKGRISIVKDEQQKFIHETEFTEWKNRGWSIGVPESKREKARVQVKGKPSWNKGIPMTEERKKNLTEKRKVQRKFSKDGIRKWFNPDQFNQALSEGWVPVRPLT